MSYADGPILFLTLTLLMRAGILTLGFLLGLLIGEALFLYKTGAL